MPYEKDLNKCLTKPPLGLKPYKMHNQQRALEIADAMKRYIIANKLIPHEWFCELKNLYAGEE